MLLIFKKLFLLLDKDSMIDNVLKHSICTNIPSSQTFRSYENFYLLSVVIEVAVACKKMWKISSHGCMEFALMLSEEVKAETFS
jgi:hypothetical protein